MNRVSKQTQSEKYESWEQVAGYFDGDGNVGVVVKYVLRFRLRFSDTRKPQVETIKAFLNHNNISTSSLWQESKGGRHEAYRIEVGALAGALAAAKAMLPFCAKKAEDLRILIDYLEGRITGNEAIERYNQEIRNGRRSGFVREPNLPFSRLEGLRRAELENARHARAAYAVNVSRAMQGQIKKDHIEEGLGHVRLSKKYGYCPGNQAHTRNEIDYFTSKGILFPLWS